MVHRTLWHVSLNSFQQHANSIRTNKWNYFWWMYLWHRGLCSTLIAFSLLIDAQYYTYTLHLTNKSFNDRYHNRNTQPLPAMFPLKCERFANTTQKKLSYLYIYLVFICQKIYFQFYIFWLELSAFFYKFPNIIRNDYIKQIKIINRTSSL